MQATKVGMRQFAAVFGTGLAMLLSAGEVLAAEEGRWLIGASGVTSQFERDDGLVDDSTLGYRLFAQVAFNRWLAVEGAYFNTGDLSSNATSAGGSDVDLVYDGFTIQGVGYLPMPVEPLEWFVRAGVFNFDVDSTIDGEVGGRGSDTGAVVGTGVSLGLTERLHGRAAFDWFDTSGASLWTIGIGLEYRFP